MQANSLMYNTPIVVVNRIGLNHQLTEKLDFGVQAL